MTTTTFADLGLQPELLEAIEELGFETPTPIQEQAIPPLLEGRDVVGRARTGSGKTAAFGLPLLQRVHTDGRVRALVLSPTRELAGQVTQALRSFAPAVKTFSVYGGTSYGPQLKALQRGLSVVVGTPGRVIDLIDRGHLDLSGLQTLVLDEGDQMLQMGFLEEVETIIQATPSERQTALFSATMPRDIRRIAETYMREPIEINVGGEAPTIDHIQQSWMRVPHHHKLDALTRVLEAERGVPTLVFVMTRKSCAEVAEVLIERGIAADAIHGDLAQGARERVLARMRTGQIDVLVGTDVAARGLDVERLELVVNYDLPDDAESYVHRIGRTGRAGREGRALSFVTPRQRRFVQAIPRMFDVRLTEMKPPTDAQVVRQRRHALERRLEDVRDQGPDEATEAVERLLATGEWDELQIAAAALHLVAEAEGVKLGALPDDELPAWAQGHRPHPDRDDTRHERRGRDDRRGSRGPRKPPEAELFIAAGKRHGIGAGDLVGAIANEFGIPGARIGPITVLEFKSFVGLSNADLDAVLARSRVLDLRGRPSKLDRARK